MMHVFGVTPWLGGENFVIGVQELPSAGMMSIVACQRHAAVGAKEMVGLCRTELLKVLPRREAMRDSEKGVRQQQQLKIRWMVDPLFSQPQATKQLKSE
ncbi:hypothetical protein OUZ56_023045 [Daphnia magna]|uniref:Uncharacterized protein n=1 Tax=Daphnia magna TaxID=35525 RepID=A0ABR0AYG8_9CRUS|nr:hypothetical protein OUZ56_023045 [Daphnia magna]